MSNHDLGPKKKLGQNYIFDFNLLSKIARAGGAGPGETVIEVGPGPGGLTRALLQEGAQVFAVEHDPRMTPALVQIQTLSQGQFDFTIADALKWQPSDHLAAAAPRLVANLPYNVASLLIAGWLESEPWPPYFKSITVMVQKEVGDRLVARPFSKAYGRLSVLCQWRADVERLFDLPPSAFTPAPKVSSSLIKLTPLAAPLPCDRPALSEVLRRTFGQRRKMLRASLKGWLPDLEARLLDLGIDPTARAETLSIAQFVALSHLSDKSQTAE